MEEGPKVLPFRAYRVEMNAGSLANMDIERDVGSALQCYAGRRGNVQHVFVWVPRAEAAVFIFQRELPR